MASASTTEVFNCTPAEFFKIVIDYPNYPQFLSEVKKCTVLKTEGERKLIEYQVSMIKSFKYSLWMTEQEPGLVSWEFAGGDIFKTMKGHWKLEDQAGKCRATYFVDATFGLFVPGPVTKALLDVNLPNMVSAYHKRIKTIYGK
ncbi:MAG: SRPBCC family protein [Bdellovibrionaceae bacterium]|nr:SRPBCC family protein [Pseudobdellovibrionaceae bacterium]